MQRYTVYFAGYWVARAVLHVGVAAGGFAIYSQVRPFSRWEGNVLLRLMLGAFHIRTFAHSPSTHHTLYFRRVKNQGYRRWITAWVS